MRVPWTSHTSQKHKQLTSSECRVHTLPVAMKTMVAMSGPTPLAAAAADHSFVYTPDLEPGCARVKSVVYLGTVESCSESERGSGVYDLCANVVHRPLLRRECSPPDQKTALGHPALLTLSGAHAYVKWRCLILGFPCRACAPVGTLSARLLSTTLPPPFATPQQQMATQRSRYLVSTSRPANVNTTRDSRSITARVVQTMATASCEHCCQVRARLPKRQTSLHEACCAAARSAPLGVARHCDVTWHRSHQPC